MKILKEIQRRTFPSLIALTALSVSASAAFYSVTGLSKLFAGASFEVMIMAGSLEVAKLVIASLLYQYWGQLNKILRAYLTLAATVLVLITSAGIYGFLSAAYQETATKSGIVDKEVQVLELKKNRFVENRDYLLGEKEQLDESINSLRDGLANNVIQYKDPETGQIITTTSRSTRNALQRQLESAISQRDKVSMKLEVATDSINSIEVQVLDVQSSSELASELGPLKYLSELTGTPMNKIINILLLVIIFVFDPLAISLVVAANFAFDKLGGPKRKEEELIVEDEEEDTTTDDIGPQPVKLNEEVLTQLEELLNKKVEENTVEEEIEEPDAEQEVLIEEDFELTPLVKQLSGIVELGEDLSEPIETELTEETTVTEDDLSAEFVFEEEEPITKEEQKELISKLVQLEDDDELYDEASDWDVTLEDGLEDEEWDEEHAFDTVLNNIIEDIEEDGEIFEEVVKHPDTKLDELKELELVEEEVIETETEDTTIFEEEDEDLGEDTTYEEEEKEEPKEVEPPKKTPAKSPYLRVGNRIIPRNVRYNRG